MLPEIKIVGIKLRFICHQTNQTCTFIFKKMNFFFCFYFQTERSFQKQPTVFLNRKEPLKAIKKQKKSLRYVRNVGLGFKTPKEVSKNFIYSLFWRERNELKMILKKFYLVSL